MKDSQRVCFVIMGFGRKTDYESGRVLDLDATFEAIIRPAASASGLRCVRADEIMHSGVIDVRMYEMLLRADLVIADISTGNANSLYELGVRHALRPRSTIIMKEAAGRLYFDLDHTNTFTYVHLGDDIGAREAKRAQAALAGLIASVLEDNIPDSPVYTFLPTLQRPMLSAEQFESILTEAEEAQRHLSDLIKAGEQAKRSSEHQAAAAVFAEALKIKPEDPYLIQQHAFNVYKAGVPSKLSALIDARSLMARLNPDESNDPETLGITGAIHKRIWQETKDQEQLNLAIRYYRRGFEIRRDYYNGENLATCFDFRAPTQTDAVEAQYDRMSARKVREQILQFLVPVTEAQTFSERSDKQWIFATLANTSFALGLELDALTYETKFHEVKPAQWEISTYEEGKKAALATRSFAAKPPEN
jgi:tetratricopeptide (TPR) repeat protein